MKTVNSITESRFVLVANDGDLARWQAFRAVAKASKPAAPIAQSK